MCMLCVCEREETSGEKGERENRVSERDGKGREGKREKGEHVCVCVLCAWESVCM